jgi:hypothetical protein
VAPVPADLAAPGGGEAGDGGIDQQLDGVAALAGVGEVAHGQVVGELGRAKGGKRGWHGELLGSASRFGSSLPGPVVAWESAARPRRTPPRAHDGPGGGRIDACQHVP